MSDVLLGPIFWHLSRALGVTAYVALTLEILFGLSASTGALDRAVGRGGVIELHRWLSAVGLGAIGAHAIVLLFDRKVSFSLLELLIPFTSAYRPFAVGLGVLAAYAALVVHASFRLRKLLGPKTWRKLHFLTFGVWGLATFHGIAAGTDATHPALSMLYAASAALVLWLTLFRIGLRVAKLDGRGAR